MEAAEAAMALPLLLLALPVAAAQTEQINALSTLMANREIAVARLANVATDALSSASRCRMIAVALADPVEKEVECSVPACGELLSEALPEHVCSGMWGRQSQGGCGPKCTAEMGSSADHCKCAPAAP